MYVKITGEVKTIFQENQDRSVSAKAIAT